MPYEIGKQTQKIQRFLQRANATGVADGVPVTRIELYQGSRNLLPISLGKYNNAPGTETRDAIVASLMEAAKDDVPLGRTRQFTVFARFGTNPDPDGGISTTFEVYHPDEDESDEAATEGKDPRGTAGLTAVGLKFIREFGNDLVKGNNQQRARDMTTIDDLRTENESLFKRIKQYQDMEFKREEERQKTLNQEADRKRKDAESERRDQITAKLLSSAEIVIGSFMPMLAAGKGGMTKDKQLSPAIKRGIDWSIKTFAESLTEAQVKTILGALNQDYDGALVDVNCMDPNELTPSPRKFLILLAMFNKGMMPAPPNEEIERFFDYLLDDIDRQNAVLNAMDMAQRIFVSAHLKARSEMRSQEAAE